MKQIRVALFISIFCALFTPGLWAASVGITFSPVQCEYLNIDWRETYNELLGMNFDLLRLGAYWSRIEKEEGKYDFSELDWQIEKAEEKNLKIVLTVGMKAPRWPEYFIPDWVFKKTIPPRWGANVANSGILRKFTLEFIAIVVKRYKDNTSIIAWQVENEPFNRAGWQDWWISKDFLAQEIAKVREFDNTERLIIVNALSSPNTFLRFLSRVFYKKDPVAEAIDSAEVPAINFYPAIGHQIWGSKICFITQPKERVEYVRQIVRYAGEKNKKLWVTELQAEPWEPGELVHLADEKPITCWPESFAIAFKELRSLGIDTVFFGGLNIGYTAGTNIRMMSGWRALNKY